VPSRHSAFRAYRMRPCAVSNNRSIASAGRAMYPRNDGGNRSGAKGRCDTQRALGHLGSPAAHATRNYRGDYIVGNSVASPRYHFLRWIFQASPLHASARFGRPMADRSVSTGYSNTRLSGVAFRTTARGTPVSNVTSLPSCSTARARRYMSVSCRGP
jgi:hypothetical protein